MLHSRLTYAVPIVLLLTLLIPPRSAAVGSAPAGKVLKGTYNIVVTVQSTVDLLPEDTSQIVLQWQNAQNYVSIDISRRGFQVVEVRDGKRTASGVNGQYMIRPGATHTLIIKRHAANLHVLFDRHPVFKNLETKNNAGRYDIRDKSNRLRISNLRIQRTGRIEVADDFSRNADQLGIWEPMSGSWSVAALQQSSFSSNAFCFRGSGKAALTATGYWFWENYRLSAAVLRHQETKALGLVVYFRDKANYTLFRWNQDRFQLVAMVNGKPHVLAQKKGFLRVEQWYELSVAVHGDKVGCYLDRFPIFEIDLNNIEDRPISTGGNLDYGDDGGIGLWVSGRNGAHFDDIFVESIESQSARPLAPRTPVIKVQFANDAVMKTWSKRVSAGGRFLDYTFHAAPTDWLAQSGNWGIQSRWACQPRWTWFGGQSDRTAAVWHKHNFEGNTVVDIYAAFRMASPFAPYYKRAGDINVTICGNGRDLSSGYSFIFAGWDNRYSKLLRGDKVVATAELTLLDNRDAFHKDALHEQWRHLRVVRKGALVQAYVDDHLALEYEDPQPLVGRKVALWTWNNHLLLARVAVGAGRTTAAPPPPAPVPKPAGIVHRWDAPGAPVTPLPIVGRDVRREPYLRFNFAGSSAMKVNLYVQVRGQPYALTLTAPEIVHRDIPVIGLFGAGAMEETPRTAQLDLRSCLQSIYADNQPLVIEAASVGLLSDDVYALSGFAGNRVGMICRFAEFALSRVAATDVDVTGRSVVLPPWEETDGPEGLCFNTFSDGVAQWRTYGGEFGATLSIDRLHTMNGAASLRLRNSEFGGTAGAVAWSKPYNPRQYPIISFDYRVPHDLRVDLRVGLDNGQFYTVKFTDFDHTWPVLGSIEFIEADLQWHHAEVDLAFLLQGNRLEDRTVTSLVFLSGGFPGVPDGVRWWIDNFAISAPPAPRQYTDNVPPDVVLLSPRPNASACPDRIRARITDAQSGVDPATIRLRVRDRDYDLSSPALSYDVRSGEITWNALLEHPFHSAFRNGQVVRCAVTVADMAGNPAQSTDWSWTAKFANDDAAPAPPYVTYVPTQRLVYQTFEENARRWGNWLNSDTLRTQKRAATGNTSLALTHLSSTGRHQLALAFMDVPIDKFPCVRFDASFEDLAMGRQITLKILKLYFDGTTDARDEVLRKVCAGGQGWTPFDADLRRQRPRNSSDPYGIVIEDSFGQSIDVGEIAGTSMYIDNFTLYSRRDATPTFAWSVPPDASGIRGYSWVCNQSPKTVPPEKIKSTSPRTQLADIKSGKWWFHVRAVDGAGNWSAVGRTMITVEK
jgi:hypothetical protein